MGKVEHPRRVFEALLDDPQNLNVANLALATGFEIVGENNGMLVLKEKEDGINTCK